MYMSSSIIVISVDSTNNFISFENECIPWCSKWSKWI